MPLRSVAGVRAVRGRTADPLYAYAEAAFLRDDLESCANLLDAYEPSNAAYAARAALLRAKIARIEGDHEAWFAAARDASRDGAPADVRLSGLALSALAARRGKGDREATRLFARTAEECDRARPDDAAYARYIGALDAWERREYDEAERLVKFNLGLVPDDAESIALSGWIAVKREDYVKAGAIFRRALAIVRKAEPMPVRHHAVLVQCVLNMAVETVDLAVCARMAKEYESITWSKNSELTRFAILGRLRYAASLEGDIERAWFFARAEATVFTEGPYAAMGETESSVITRALGDDRAADLQLKTAWNIVRTHRWGDANAEERIALLDFACVAAAHRTNDARKSLMLYLSMTEKEDPKQSLTRDRRVTATEFLAAGRLAEALRDRHEAIAQYRRALSLFEELGCVMRAAEVALDLIRVTRHAVYLETIDVLAERAPKAYLVRRAREFEGPLGFLGPIQRGILRSILRGESAKSIAAEIGRSPFTVINHTRRIFEAFEVHSRPELRRACAKLKITPESIP